MLCLPLCGIIICGDWFVLRCVKLRQSHHCDTFSENYDL